MCVYSKSYILFLLSVVLLLNSCANVFESTANKTTDAALYEDAVKANDAGSFDTAITKILSMSTAKQAETGTKQLLAAAYAGKCGFSFAGFFTAVKAGNGSTPLLKWLMNQWTTTATSRTYCKLAETTMKTISPTYVGRSSDDSLFMVFLGLAKTGIYLRELVDTNKDGNADNPPFDGTTNSFCLSANISDADVAEIITGIGIAVSNLANVSASLGSFSLASALGAACTGSPNPCTVEDPALLLVAPTNTIKAFRGVMNDTAVLGLGLVNGIGICP